MEHPALRRFLWGTATSAFQMEGGPHSDWATWRIRDEADRTARRRGVRHVARTDEDLALRLPFVGEETAVGVRDELDFLGVNYCIRMFVKVKPLNPSTEGTDIRGYFWWSLMDNYEWLEGLRPRFGLYRVDFDSLERSATGAAEAYSRWIARHPNPRIVPEPSPAA